MKRHNDLYQKIYSFENLYEAYKSARKDKSYRDDVLKFTANLEENLITIQNELIWKTYEIGKYREFYVFEPKKRLIMALPFRDRVVQWAIYRLLNPIFDMSFIGHSYACRQGKGPHSAADKLQYWLRYLDRKEEEYYYLKLDISKYFYRVDHEVNDKIIQRKIKDRDLMWLLRKYFENDEVPFGLPLGVEPGECTWFERLFDKGMPIGDLMSQLRANIQLNPLDQFCKHDLKLRRYIRYMDDFIILHHDKKYLHYIKNEIESFLNNELELHLNDKTCISPCSKGVKFVGYTIFATHRKMKKKTVLRMKRRLKYLQEAYTKGEVSFEKVNASVQSYLGLLEHCDSYNLQKKLLEALVFVRR